MVPRPVIADGEDEDGAMIAKASIDQVCGYKSRVLPLLHEFVSRYFVVSVD